MMVNKNEIRQHHNIDRKLRSNNYLQVVEALTDLQKFLSSLAVEEIFNSLMMRVVDIFSTSKISYLRIKSSSILVNFRERILTLPSREEIINNLTKCIKSKDQFTRILTLQTIEKLAKLFEKDNSLYHILLDRLKTTNNLELKEKIETIKCISTILHSSEYLSKLFSRNMQVILNVGKINLNIFLYICAYAKYQVQELPNIIVSIWNLCQNQLKSSKKMKYYMSKLIYNSCKKNYKVISIYYKYIQETISSLASRLQYIKIIWYPFIQNKRATIYNVNDKQLLDICYYTPYQQIEELSLICCNRIHEGLAQENISKQKLLLSFYCSNRELDRQILKVLKHKNVDSKELLKISLVCANYECAQFLNNKLLNKVHQSFTPYIIIKSYLDFQLSKQEQKVGSFNMMYDIIHNICIQSEQDKLLYLLNMWKNGNKIEIEEENARGKIKCEDQINEKGRMPLKLYKIEGPLIYFGKKTVIDILSKL